jgi:predicted dehydrogenase
MLNGEYCFDWLPPSDHWLWQPDNGNGFLNENSGHLFDAVCYLMGKPVAVMAESVNFRGSPSAEAAAITLRFENGSAASLMVGGLGAGAIKAYPRINIFTASGQAHLQGQGHIWDSLTWATRGSAATQTYSEAPEVLGHTRYRHAMQHFIACVRSGETPSASIEAGIQAVALAEATYESARTGQRIRVRL